jgi:hypothetical protein
MKKLMSLRPANNLFPMFINPDSGSWMSSVITLGAFCAGTGARRCRRTCARPRTGARADSLYEYFLKQWIMSRGTDVLPKQLYDDSVISMFKNVREPPISVRCLV